MDADAAAGKFFKVRIACQNGGVMLQSTGSDPCVIQAFFLTGHSLTGFQVRPNGVFRDRNDGHLSNMFMKFGMSCYDIA